VDWVKKNKLAALLILIFLLWGLRGLSSSFLGLSSVRVPPGMMVQPGFEGAGIGSSPLNLSKGISVPAREYAPSMTKERLVVEESSMSLVVADVRESADKIIDQAKQAGGYMVSSSLSRPEEAPFATVVVRVPAENFRQTLDFFRKLAVKVTSENILGDDVTDQYTDIQARLATLEKTKTKFESILDQAARIEDILNVQREIISLQDQIDSLKGQAKYLEQTAKLAKITAYLSTDELALPYAPTKTFRPAVILKQAVRSLITTLRSLAGLGIWVVVYAAIWAPVLLGIFIYRKWKAKRNPPLCQ